MIASEQRMKWIEELIEHFEALVGKEILIYESISRSREVGKHDRHFATHSQFKMQLKDVGVSFSGLNLMLEGEDVFFYGIACEKIVNVRRASENDVEIVEWFEEQTERLSTICVIASGATE